MEAIQSIPVEVRLGLLCLLGFVVGGQINRGIYWLAWHRRHISPWSPPPESAPPRRWYDRVPIAGWFFLRREWPIHGKAFWVRPALLELATGAAFAGLYYFEISGGLLAGAISPSPATIHIQYAAHLLLFCLMAVATFIDLDEQTIPDSITVPGTLAALVIAALLPAAALPVLGRGSLFAPPPLDALRLTSPLAWPTYLDGGDGLLIGLLCYTGWWFAILHKTWTLRHGWIRAMRYMIVSILRRQPWISAATLLVAGLLGIMATWLANGDYWRSLLSSLVGMAFGGGLIWAVRIIGSTALGKEAMGFGDVTLMAMIGAFVGWQPALLIFFLAPFAALFISITQWLLTRRHDIAFGPYLCLAAALLIVGWARFWIGWASDIFSLGWYIPGMVVVCLALMGLLLFAMRLRPSPMVSEMVDVDPQTGAGLDHPAVPERELDHEEHEGGMRE